MILQTLHSISEGKIECFMGEYRFKLTTILSIQHKLEHQIRYVIVHKIGVEQHLENKGLITESQPNNF